MLNEFPVNTRYAPAHLKNIDFSNDISEKLAAWLSNPKGFIVFLGNPGIGKTYFCASVINYYLEHKKPVRYKTEGDFFSILRNSISEQGGDYFHKVKTMAGYDLLWLIDDLGSSQMTEWQKEVLLLFVDELYQNKKAAIFTSNIWLQDMKSMFSGRFASRMGAKENTIIELNWDDKRQLGL